MTRWQRFLGTTSGTTRKYRNRIITKEESFDGRVYHSAGEHERSRQLSMLEDAGEIFELRKQVRFRLCVAGTRVATYIADFVYRRGTDGFDTVEDYKGVQTPEFKLKWKLLQALYPSNRYIITGARDVRKNNLDPQPKTRRVKGKTTARGGTKVLDEYLPGLGPRRDVPGKSRPNNAKLRTRGG